MPRPAPELGQKLNGNEFREVATEAFGSIKTPLGRLVVLRFAKWLDSPQGPHPEFIIMDHQANFFGFADYPREFRTMDRNGINARRDGMLAEAATWLDEHLGPPA